MRFTIERVARIVLETSRIVPGGLEAVGRGGFHVRASGDVVPGLLEAFSINPWRAGRAGGGRGPRGEPPGAAA